MTPEKMAEQHREDRLQERIAYLESLSLTKLREKFSEEAGNWNGEDAKGEEEAMIALDIIRKLDELHLLFAEWAD